MAPVMSAGRRSAVNCTRRNPSPTEWARALARVVLPRPGRSSTSRWPLGHQAAHGQHHRPLVGEEDAAHRGHDGLEELGRRPGPASSRGARWHASPAGAGGDAVGGSGGWRRRRRRAGAGQTGTASRVGGRGAGAGPVGSGGAVTAGPTAGDGRVGVRYPSGGHRSPPAGDGCRSDRVENLELWPDRDTGRSPTTSRPRWPWPGWWLPPAGTPTPSGDRLGARLQRHQQRRLPFSRMASARLFGLVAGRSDRVLLSERGQAVLSGVGPAADQARWRRSVQCRFSGPSSTPGRDALSRKPRLWLAGWWRSSARPRPRRRLLPPS